MARVHKITTYDNYEFVSVDFSSNINCRLDIDISMPRYIKTIVTAFFMECHTLSS